MALLSRWRVLRRIGGPPRAWIARGGLILGLGLIEVLGRGAFDDVDDLYALGALLVVVAIWLAIDRPARRALRRGAGRVRAAFLGALPTIGVDLRGEPVIPRGEPTILRRFALVCMALTALEVGWILRVDAPFRAVVGQVSYVALLLLTAALWAALLAIVVFSVSLVGILVLDTMRLRDGHTRRAKRWILGYLVTVVLGVLFVPDGIALLAMGASVVLYSIAEAREPLPRLSVLWRDREGRIGAFDLHQWIAVQSLLVAWPIANVSLAALGGRAFGFPSSGTTTITDMLGAGAAWFSGVALLVLTWIVLSRLRLLLATDPAVPCPTSVHMTPARALPIDAEPRAHRRLESRGWRVRRPPERADPADVRIRLVERMPPPRGRIGWPLVVSATALDAPELLDLIARRDVVQRRRLLLRGLARMLKRARRQRFSRGTGFWIAPHQWFVAGLTRDEDEAEFVDDATMADSMIGEPYERAIPRAARHYAYEVFSALEVDLLFMEDGVAWRDLRRVLRRAFEHHEAGAGRVEDVHFSGIPHIRVILHRFEIGGKLGRDRYPEPDYEDLGRARVLHVFKDRGGDEVDEPTPAVDEGRPLLVP